MPNDFLLGLAVGMPIGCLLALVAMKSGGRPEIHSHAHFHHRDEDEDENGDHYDPEAWKRGGPPAGLA